MPLFRVLRFVVNRAAVFIYAKHAAFQVVVGVGGGAFPPVVFLR